MNNNRLHIASGDLSHLQKERKRNSLIPSLILAFVFYLINFISGCASTPEPSALESKTRLISTSISKDVTKSQGFSIPVDETNIFSTEDSQVVMWVKIKDISDEHTLRWEWYDPKGSLYYSTREYTINSGGRYRDYSASWHKIAIKGEKASTLAGKWTAKVYLDNKVISTKEFEITSLSNIYKYIPTDTKIKIKPDRSKWALIIGIEKYRKASPVLFAEKDARTIKDYLIRYHGVPEENIITLLNETATKVEIEVMVRDRLKGLLREKDTIYVYFSGHGIPADETPYLLPYDGDPESPGITSYPVDALYRDLDQLPAKDIYVFMDTCFSGRSGREEKEELIMAGVRPGVLRVKDPILLSKKIVALTAAKSNQLSNYYKDKEQGLFTYYLLKGLIGEADINGDKKIQIGELFEYIKVLLNVVVS